MPDTKAPIDWLYRPVDAPFTPLLSIDDKYAALGGAAGVLGHSVGAQQPGAGGGVFQQYDGGTIFWSPAFGAHEIDGPFLEKYVELGGPDGFLGYPTSDVTPSNDGGYFATFIGGVILGIDRPWLGDQDTRQAAPAYEVHGEILAKYLRLGANTGFLGYPCSDEEATDSSGGRVSHFERGAIVWSPQTGAHEVHGTISTAETPGKNRSFLGFHKAFGDPGSLWLGGIVVLVIFLLVGVILSEPDPGQMSDREYENLRIWCALAIPALIVLWLFNIVRLSRTLREPREDLGYSLYQECRGMAAYALQRGLPVDSADLATISRATHKVVEWANKGTSAGELVQFGPDHLKHLNDAHQHLSKIVEPAVPKTLRLLNTQVTDRGVRTQAFPWLGSIRLVRMMIVLVALMIPTFVALGIDAGTRLNDAAGLFEGNSIEKAQTALYLTVAAALGAAFAALMKAFRYIGNLSYDDKFEASYWLRFVLGVVSGLMLSVVLSQAFFFNGGTAEGQSEQSGTLLVTVPLLAIVGGFSSDLVYRLLTRVVEAIDTLLQGGPTERIEEVKEASALREKERDLENRHELAAKIVQIRKDFPAESEAKGDKVLGELLDRLLTEVQK